MEKCAYCEIVKGLQPCHKIWENDEFLAFLSIFPNTDGFTILITKEHLPAYIFDLPDDMLNKFIVAAKTVAKLLDSKLDDVGRTGLIVESTGVNHAHIKLIPMHGTKNISKWKPTSSYLDKYFKKYEGYLSSHDSTRKSDNELEKIAKKIRN
ncbi:MAG: HIT family protein [Parachlamydiales bacterium]|jgi:diadenosine tetraphosphate (Ap4A) HIT family hydrolase